MAAHYCFLSDPQATGPPFLCYHCFYQIFAALETCSVSLSGPSVGRHGTHQHLSSCAAFYRTSGHSTDFPQPFLSCSRIRLLVGRLAVLHGLAFGPIICTQCHHSPFASTRHPRFHLSVRHAYCRPALPCSYLTLRLVHVPLLPMRKKKQTGYCWFRKKKIILRLLAYVIAYRNPHAAAPDPTAPL